MSLSVVEYVRERAERVSQRLLILLLLMHLQLAFRLTVHLKATSVE